MTTRPFSLALSRPLRRKYWLLSAAMLLCSRWSEVKAQTVAPISTSTQTETTDQQIKHLNEAVAQAQAQIEANQKLLVDLKQQLLALQQQIAKQNLSTHQQQSADGKSSSTPNPAPGVPPSVAASLDDIREHQAIDESQIATHESTKVESESKYPLTVSGLILFNTFINTRQVDIASAPAYAIPGPGSTGLSLRQSVLGLDARGPHLFGASSHADVRVDFFGNAAQSGYDITNTLRLRTAHASLRWASTEAFFSLDRTLLEPNSPSSLIAVGQPELAWSGNLWTWNPQIGLKHDFELSHSTYFDTEAALIDVADPQLPGASKTTALSATERSRWPGSQARLAVRRGEKGLGPEIGIGGYFSPHTTTDNIRFNSWAESVDFRLPISRHFEATINAYRGQGLGGLGGGGYVDYVYRDVSGNEIPRALHDEGGWAQWKFKTGQRWEINNGYGIDNPFANQIKVSQLLLTTAYPGLARNRSYFGNVILSPSKYLLFSLEYRRLWSNYATGSTSISDVIGIGAGYKF